MGKVPLIEDAKGLELDIEENCVILDKPSVSRQLLTQLLGRIKLLFPFDSLIPRYKKGTPWDFLILLLHSQAGKANISRAPKKLPRHRSRYFAIESSPYQHSSFVRSTSTRGPPAIDNTSHTLESMPDCDAATPQW